MARGRVAAKPVLVGPRRETTARIAPQSGKYLVKNSEKLTERVHTSFCKANFEDFRNNIPYRQLFDIALKERLAQ
jgi:hypothetical protein